MQHIRNELQDRMDLFGIDISTLSNMAFVDETIIRDMLNENVMPEDMDEFDLSLICNALHCDIQYFTDDETRKKDLLVSSANKKDTIKSNYVKAKLQDFMTDYAFIDSILSENT